jgi:hypothetical protein
MATALTHDEFMAVAKWFFECGQEGVVTFEQSWELFKEEAKRRTDGK